MRVVVVRFSSFGDCILLCPLLAHLKRAGASEVVVVTKRVYAELFAMAEGVDRIVAVERGATFADLIRIGRSLRESRDDDTVVLDAHSNPRSRVLSAAAGGARARFQKFYWERANLIVFKRPTRLPTMLEQYGALAVRAGLGAATLSPGGIRLPHDAVQRAKQRIGAEPAVAVAPGSRWRSKRWNGFADVCAGLVSAGHRVVLVGDAHDREFTRPIAESLGERCIDAAGEPSVAHTAALVSRCGAFLGNDSGLMHLAEAVGTRVVALFGPTVHAFGYAPSLDRSVTLERAIACRPCSRNGAPPCPKRTYECLEKIRADDVLRAVLNPSAGETRRMVVD